MRRTRLALGGPAVAPARVTTGIMTGQWCPPPPATGQFLDQSRDDAQSAIFDGEPLTAPVELFGEPVVRLRLRHPGPRTLVSVKLHNVAPDGSAQPVTTAAVNIAIAGETALELPLMAAGWRFAAGHRIRVAVAVGDWPNLWPLPQVAPLEITSAVELELPGLPADAVAFEPADEPLGRDRPARGRRPRPARSGMSSPTCSPAAPASSPRCAPDERSRPRAVASPSPAAAGRWRVTTIR